MHRDQRAERRLAALDLLAGERLGDEVEPGAAVLLRDHDAEDPELGHALDQLQVELVVDVVLDRDRQDALVDEGAHRVLDQPLLVGELEVHGASLAGPRTRAVPSIDSAFRSRTYSRRPSAPWCSRTTPRAASRSPAIVHQRDAVAARVARCGRRARGRRRGRRSAGIVRGDDLAATVEADDARWPLEGAEHEADTAVLAQVGGRLGPAPDVVVVLDGAPVDDPERVDRPLRRHVHVPARRRRRRDEEQALASDPAGELVVDRLVDLAHRALLATLRRYATVLD